MSIVDFFGSETTEETTNLQQNREGTTKQSGRGHGNITGDQNTQRITSGEGQAGNNNRRQKATGIGNQAGNRNRRQKSTGFSNAANIEGRANVQNVGRGDAFQGANMSRTNVKGDFKSVGSNSTIHGDLTNRDYNLELVAEGGSKITFEQGDSGVSEAIADLGRALGKTSTNATVQVGDALKRQQVGDISKQLLYAIGALILGAIFLRRK